jgi:hypothetical protein
MSANVVVVGATTILSPSYAYFRTKLKRSCWIPLLLPNLWIYAFSKKIIKRKLCSSPFHDNQNSPPPGLHSMESRSMDIELETPLYADIYYDGLQLECMGTIQYRSVTVLLKSVCRETIIKIVKGRAQPGFQPGTSCTQSRNHTPRPLSHISFLSINIIFDFQYD